MYDFDVKTQLDLLNDCLDYWMDNLIFDCLVTKPCVVIRRTTPVTVVSPLAFVSPYDCGDPPPINRDASPSNSAMSPYTDDVSLPRHVVLTKRKNSRAIDIVDPSTGENVLL